MKAKLLIFVAIVLITASACHVSREMLTLDTPSITIKDVNVITSGNKDKVKVICYTINLYSPSSLSEFVAQPDIAGINDDSQYKLEFGNHTRRATVTYYYAVPDNAKSQSFSIKFRLKNVNQEVNSEIEVCAL